MSYGETVYCCIYEAASCMSPIALPDRVLCTCIIYAYIFMKIYNTSTVCILIWHSTKYSNTKSRIYIKLEFIALSMFSDRSIKVN